MNALNQIYIYRLPLDITGSLRPRDNAGPSDARPAQAHESSSEDEPDDTDDELAETEGALKEASLVENPSTVRTSSAGSPISWYTSASIPAPTKIGVYKAMLLNPGSTLMDIQLGPGSTAGRTIAMFMVGGGHFQGTIISLDESSVDKCGIKASKGFHRYTTRRKQGGAQSTNDNAKGAANSAGAQIRRYNEIALAQDVRELLKEWNSLLATVDIILVRASGPSSKKLLYENGLDKHDPRVRGFPLNTRRATQSEIIRSFHILSRLQVGSTEDDIEETRNTPSMMPVTTIKPVEIKPDVKQVEHTDKLTTLIKRNKVPAIRAYIADHGIKINEFQLEPKKSYLHAPNLLHFAAFTESSPAISVLLDLKADPRIVNDVSKTAFEVAGSKEARDSFRMWRGLDGNEQKWDWEAARVPAGLTSEQIKARKARQVEQKALTDAEEDQRRRAEMARLEREVAEDQAAAKAEQDRKRGPGRSLPMGLLGTSSMTSLEGMTPEMKKKVERERRARAAEARFKK
ncbi:protein of unknown function [Taphrina deformans PYCC 5710]|uniref:VLRF1 domain-containing protein n=1 Tax=Taphrina deformans (strain PYCC 5710 / ATCC 11124 / CBS 356.35 / IMI 108563 / JCM 9778 / NBRC 8474) TaxID=1097556 RepID=R4XJQ0_TAPDE|nr:protein of unknown function [Taphrina deformans PYCC 5710]|eukprot:CCG84658.1 protein of unknown function [Taphrina deformans PYCC 5710]